MARTLFLDPKWVVGSVARASARVSRGAVGLEKLLWKEAVSGLQLLRAGRRIMERFEEKDVEIVEVGKIVNSDVEDVRDYLRTFSDGPFGDTVRALAEELESTENVFEAVNPETDMPIGVNAVFVRDPVLVLPRERTFIPLPINPIRRPETLLLSYVLERLGYERLETVFGPEDRMEGGDVRYFDGQIAFLGQGPRSREGTVEKVGQILSELFDVVVIVRRKSRGAFTEKKNMDTMHLDTFMGFGNRSAYVYKAFAFLPVDVVEGRRRRRTELVTVLREFFDEVIILGTRFLLNLEFNTALFRRFLFGKRGKLLEIAQELGERAVALPLEPYNKMYGSIHCITKEIGF